MPEPMKHPTPTIDDSHRLIRERAGFASMADMRAHIEAQAAEIRRLESDLYAEQLSAESMANMIDRLESRIDNALTILNGENTWLAIVMSARAELEKAKAGH